MPTGACGINCDACRLNRDGVCSSCGSGASEQAGLKLEAQERLLGATCPLLACARLNQVEYCMRDCDQFPCENFDGIGGSGYPYSKGFIAMQRRRRAMHEEAGRTENELVIPEAHWQEIGKRGLEEVARCVGAQLADDGCMLLETLSQTLRIKLEHRSLEIEQRGKWLPAPALVAFVAAVHLANAKSVPLSGRWVSEKDLSCSEFFRGPHQLRTEAVLERFGNAAEDFVRAAIACGGVKTNDVGDAAVRLWVFPTIPVKLILWCGDEELGPSLTVMFDQSIDELLPGDGIWALVEMVCETLVEASI